MDFLAFEDEKQKRFQNIITFGSIICFFKYFQQIYLLNFKRVCFVIENKIKIYI